MINFDLVPLVLDSCVPYPQRLHPHALHHGSGVQSSLEEVPIAGLERRGTNRRREAE